MKLLYDGQEVGTITTNHSMSIEDACEILDIDLTTLDENEVGCFPELFEIVY